MNINTKHLLASPLLTALFAGTAAHAQIDPHANDFIDNATAKVEIVKATFTAPVVETEYEFTSGKR